MYGRRKHCDELQQKSISDASTPAYNLSPRRTRHTTAPGRSRVSSQSSKEPNDLFSDTDSPTDMHSDEGTDDTYEMALDTFRKLFCPQCMTYDCNFHCFEDFDAGTQAAVASELEKNNKNGYWERKESLWARNKREASSPSIDLNTNASAACSNGQASFRNGGQSISSRPTTIESVRIALRRPERVVKHDMGSSSLEVHAYTGHELTRFQKWTAARMLTMFGGDYTRLQRATGKDFTSANLPATPFTSYSSSAFPKTWQKKRNHYSKDVTERISQEINEKQGFFFPCYHEGPCTKDNDCTCIKNDFVCTSQCIWGPFSSNYFRGCRCPGRCESDTCPCRASFRECILDVCHCAGNTCDIDSECCNMMCTLGRRASMVVAPSTIPNAGWGLFAAKRICIGDYIDEVRRLSTTFCGSGLDHNFASTHLFHLFL